MDSIWRSRSQLFVARPESKAGVLRALIAVMNDIAWPALGDRHVERSERQISVHLIADQPAHHAPAPDAQNDGQADEVDPGWHVVRSDTRS